jgi:hypothetical protein
MRNFLLEEFEARRNFEVYEDKAAFAALKTRHEREMSRVLALHPALANPAPPVPLERINGTFVMKASEVWDELVDAWQSGAWHLLIIERFTDENDWGLYSGTRTVNVPAGQTVEAFLSVARQFDTSGASPAQTITWRDSFLNLVATKR